MEPLFSAFDSSLSGNDCKAAVGKHEETVFMAKLSLNGGLNLFHHFKEIGGTLYEKDKDAGFIIGISQSIATTMTPDTEKLFEKPSCAVQVVPTVTSILKVTSEEEIDDLQVSTAQKFKPRNLVPVPPFLVNPISSAISASKGNAKVVLLATVATIMDFDASHIGDDEYKDIASQKCKPLLFWLFLAIQNNTFVQPIQSEGCGSVKVVKEFEKTTMDCLNGGTSDNSGSHLLSLKRPLEIMAASVTSTQSLLQSMSQIQHQVSDKSSKSFKKIPVQYQNMLLVASSVGQAIPESLNEDAMDFFSNSNSMHGQLKLNSMLEAARLQVSVSPALATCLQNGCFLWTNVFTPSGLAGSVMTTENVIRADSLHNALVLEYSTKFEMSNSSLAKLTKTSVVFPTSVHESIDRFNALRIISAFFFGEISIIPQSLLALTNWCENNKNLIQTRILMDPEFLAKFTLCVDDRIHQWLQQCCTAKMITDTEIRLLNFKEICMDIQVQRFFYSLPPSVKTLDLSTNSKNDATIAPNGNGKKQKQEKVQAKQVRNNNVLNEVKLRDNEAWNTIFSGKSKDGPMLSFGCQGCVKWFTKGICYDDCFFRASHKQLIGTDTNLYCSYVKKLRGE